MPAGDLAALRAIGHDRGRVRVLTGGRVMSAGERALHGMPGVPLALRGPAPVRVVAGFGFWLFLLSDIIVFAALFATYAVLSGSTAGGPSGAELFDKPRVFLETMCLLASSVTCGFGIIGDVPNRRSSDVLLDGDYVPPGSVLSDHGRQGVREHGCRRRRALSQRLSVSLFHARRNARLARQRGSDLAHRHAASGQRRSASSPWSFADSTASACSGMRSTSSGSVYSPSYIWERNNGHAGRGARSCARGRPSRAARCPQLT